MKQSMRRHLGRERLIIFPAFSAKISHSFPAGHCQRERVQGWLGHIPDPVCVPAYSAYLSVSWSCDYIARGAKNIAKTFKK